MSRPSKPMGRFTAGTGALSLLLTVFLAASVLAATQPSATLCFFGNINPTGYAYVSYLQPRFENVKFTPAVVGIIDSSVPIAARVAQLRSDIQSKHCTVVFDNGGNDEYEQFRAMRGEPGMPLWIEKENYKEDYNTTVEPEKYPALRMWSLKEDQSITAINTLLALDWKDIVMVSTNKTGDNVTLAQMTKQANDAGLKIHGTYIQGEDGLVTDDQMMARLTAESPTRAVLIATTHPTIVQPLVDAPRGFVPIVPLSLKGDLWVVSSLGVLSAQEFKLTPHVNWTHHWREDTNISAVQEAWAPAKPPSWTSFYFSKTAALYTTDIDPVLITMALVDQFYNSTSTAPTAQDLLQLARGFETNSMTEPVRIANHSLMTLIPPRSHDVVLTQPPKDAVYYKWTVIANVTNGVQSWVTTAQLQWPAIGKVAGVVSVLFPIPEGPATKTDWAVMSILIILGVLIVGAIVAGIVYLMSRWLGRRHCPKDGTAPFTAFFVSTHNEDEIRDLYGYKARDVFGGVRSIVASAASDHNCYVARRLEAHYLIVSKSPESAVKCAAQVVTNAAKLTARPPPAPIAKIRRHGTGTPSGRGTYTVTAGSDTKSERSTQSRMAAGIAQSQSRKTGITPHIAVGMAFATGHIDFEDGVYTYGGEPVEVAASIADFAVHNQILATQELVQAVSPKTTANFEEYCEREFGRGQCAENYELLEYVADGCPRADIELADAARQDTSESSIVPGALSAALQAQAGGLAARSVATVAIHIPELGLKSVSAATIHRFQDAFAIVQDISSDFKGTFAAMHDGWCIVTVNGTGGVAQAPMRATSLAVAAVDTLRDSGYAATAGVAAGPTIAGGVAGDAVAARHMTSGGSAERARLLALGAATHNAAVLVTDGVKREADSAFEFAAVDFIAARTAAPAAASKNDTHLTRHGHSVTSAHVHRKGSSLSEASFNSGPGKSPKNASASNSVTASTSVPPAVHKGMLQPSGSKTSSPDAPAELTVPAVKTVNNGVVANDSLGKAMTQGDEGLLKLTGAVNAGGASAGDHDVIAAVRYRAMLAFGVVAASNADEVNDEWMYQLAAAGSGPCVRINAAFEQIAEGVVAEARVKLSEASAALTTVDNPALAGVDGEGQAVLKAAVARGEVLCSAVGGQGGEDHLEQLTTVALERSVHFAGKSV